jgi:hypothetical protein
MPKGRVIVSADDTFSSLVRMSVSNMLCFGFGASPCVVGDESEQVEVATGIKLEHRVESLLLPGFSVEAEIRLQDG